MPPPERDGGKDSRREIGTSGETTWNSGDGETTWNSDDGETTWNSGDGENTWNSGDGKSTWNSGDGENTWNSGDIETTWNQGRYRHCCFLSAIVHVSFADVLHLYGSATWGTYNMRIIAFV